MSAVMGCRSALRPKLLITFLLASTNIVCLHGDPITDVNHNLHCVNDYLFTINCTLNIPPSETSSDSSSSYWLTFEEIHELKEKFVCNLTKNNKDYFCSVTIADPMPDDYYSDIFSDSDIFNISLCHNQNGSKNCVELEDEYEPEENIKLNPPCCLTVSHNSSQCHFTWRSTYEQYEHFTGLTDNIKYQLYYYKRGDKHNVLSHVINTNNMSYSVADENFEPGTEYAARVRSSPNQAYYMGLWSDWSSEVYCKTELTENDLPPNTFVSGLVKVLISLCVMVPFALLFCYTPVKKWKQSAFIPTPEPYFHTLYSDCQGDFRSWVITQENTADMLKAEETLQIDTLTKCAVVEEEEHQLQCRRQLMEGNTYSNISDLGCDESLLGIPYAVITMAPLSSPESSQPGSPTEGDSGCWLERDTPWYFNEYCTLSAFQQSSPITAEHPGSPTKFCPTGII
ncbi:interleukin-21 receptor [Centropristis striata]|uniref:interleukin-21 receptor n=1 Tax=Centropristis striata TaxID=184440 RepID=UPI0027E1FB59|nr:interleukin-21 receptor [Centropristis striata]